MNPKLIAQLNPKYKSKIKRLVETSTEVIEDCSLPNGAIIAANSDLEIYPDNVNSYRYVWIRDGAYTCIAADILGMREIPEKFFDWCLNRAENFMEKGMLYTGYNTNGTLHGTTSIPPEHVNITPNIKELFPSAITMVTQFQPDQYGILLIAAAHHHKLFGSYRNQKEIITHTADSLCRFWKNKEFTNPCFEPWEERPTLPGKRMYHLYSMSVCIKGLKEANEMYPNKKWKRVWEEMSSVFDEIYSKSDKALPRTWSLTDLKTEHIHTSNPKINLMSDSSLLGLVYPSDVLSPDDPKMTATVDDIIKNNSTRSGGIMRYPGDMYCDGVKNGWVTLTGAGAWPILNFWMGIYFARKAETEKAVRYYEWVLKRTGDYIPEQIFEGKKKPVIVPLCWSHAMFVIASRELGLI